MNRKLKHRYAKASLTLLDASGAPINKQEVHVRQTSHKFLFGCNGSDAIELTNSPNDTTAVAARMDKWLKIFNFATLPFYWAMFEREKGKPDTESLKNAVNYLKERGVKVKGHPLCWHTLAAPWLLEMSDEDIMQAVLDRIERDATAFNGLLDGWDVINEVVIMPVFDKYDNGITRICNRYGRVELVRRVFEKARECDKNAILLINDFNTSPAYEKLISDCLDAGIKFDAIGIQSHQHQGYWGLKKLKNVLKRFSKFGLPLHFSENNLCSGELMPADIDDLNDYVVDSWPSIPELEIRQAENIREMYTTLFECPLVEAITQWDFTDGRWLKAPVGVLREDDSIKPAYETLDSLINHEWHTEETLRTDKHGRLSFSGFKGGYTVECGGKEVSLDLSQDCEQTIKLG